MDELSTCRGLALGRTASLNRADKPEQELSASADGGPPTSTPPLRTVDWEAWGPRREPGEKPHSARLLGARVTHPSSYRSADSSPDVPLREHCRECKQDTRP